MNTKPLRVTAGAYLLSVRMAEQVVKVSGPGLPPLSFPVVLPMIALGQAGDQEQAESGLVCPFLGAGIPAAPGLWDYLLPTARPSYVDNLG